MNASGCAVPLVVGVTGGLHESAELRDAIEAAFARILLDLRTNYPHTPLLVLAAEGYDGPAIDAARAQQAGIARERSLTRVSHFSDILVVFSDGAQPDTSAVVAQREKGRAAENRRLLEPPEVATTYHVAVPRDRAGSAPLAVRRIFPHRFSDDRRSAVDFAAALERLDRFNADIAASAAPGAQLRSEHLFTAVDSTANRLQRALFFWQRVLFTLAFAAAAAQILGNALGSAEASIKVIAVILTVGAYFVVRRSDFQNRYQDYRALGEGLRVLSAWTHAGVPDSVDTSYLRMQQTELLWIRSALRTIGFLQSDDRAAARDPAAVRRWVAEQRAYFRGAAAMQGARKEMFGRITGVLAPLNLIVGFVLLTVLALPPAWYPGWLDPVVQQRAVLRNTVGIVAGFAALVIAMTTTYTRTRAFSENANRYQRMFLLFDEASRLLAAIPPPAADQEREIARELGREALAEHAEWLLSQRERPVGVVYTSAA